MRKINLFVLLWLSMAFQGVVGQHAKTIIPFQLTTHNNIAIRAVLNEADTVQLMFHTAANAMTLTEEATRKLRRVVFNKTIDEIKSWGGTTNDARVSEQNLLQIEGLRWSNLTITENKNTGPFTDGKFGIDLFKDKVIQLDFVKKEITISENLPKHLRKYQKLKLTHQDDLLFVEAHCEVEAGSRFDNKFLIHSGYGGGVLLDDQFVNDNKLDEKLKIVDEKELKDSYGNILKTKRAILPVLGIGSATLSDVPVGFFSGSLGRQKISVLGGDILKRFNIIIDAKREYIYLKTNHLKG